MSILGNITVIILALLIYIIIRAELLQAKTRKKKFKLDILKRLDNIDTNNIHTKCAHCPIKHECSEYQLFKNRTEYKLHKEEL